MLQLEHGEGTAPRRCHMQSGLPHGGPFPSNRAAPITSFALRAAGSYCHSNEEERADRRKAHSRC